MNAIKVRWTLMLLAAAASGFGQSTPTITSASYDLPAPVNVAPGQILTVFVQGIGSTLTSPVRAPGSSLPTSLVGISAIVQQGADRSAGILEVRPVSTCNPPGRTGTGVFPQPITNCGRLTAVTLQIPFNIGTTCNVCIGVRPGDAAPTSLRISENGTSSAVLELTPLSDKIHVLTVCDTFLTTAVPPTNYTGVPCSPLVTHADGSLMSHSSPAKAGEVLVAYAVGLGATTPALTAGQLTTSAAVTTVAFTLQFNFLPNASPVRPNGSQAPLFTGATPGYIGLYQINFRVPTPPAGTPTCGSVDVNQFDPGTNIIQSNLTVSIGGAFSFDGAGLCVVVP